MLFSFSFSFYYPRWLPNYVEGPIWLAFFWSAHFVSGWRGLLKIWTRTNLLLAAGNLLPVPPLDGARLVDIMFVNSSWNGGGADHWILTPLAAFLALGLLVFIPWLLIGDVIRVARFELLLYRAQPDFKKIREQRYIPGIYDL